MNNPQNHGRHSIEKYREASTNCPNVDHLSIFQALVVADHLSFSRAAQVLGVRQSAVSRRVQALENQLGVSLFERHVNGVRVTLAGRLFLDRTRLALAEIDRAVQSAGAAGRGAEGVVRVGILPSMLSGFLGDLLRDFRTEHPGVALDFFEGSALEQIARIIERRLDVAFVIEGYDVPSCDVERLWSTRICVALPDQHPLAGCDAVDTEYLKDEHLIFGRDATGAEFYRHVANRLEGFEGKPSIESYNISQDAVMQLVGRGFGFSFVAETSTATRYPDVVFRALASEGDQLSYSALWLPGNDNPALRRLLSLARVKAAERRSEPSPASDA